MESKYSDKQQATCTIYNLIDCLKQIKKTIIHSTGNENSEMLRKCLKTSCIYWAFLKIKCQFYSVLSVYHLVICIIETRESNRQII